MSPVAPAELRDGLARARIAGPLQLAENRGVLEILGQALAEGENTPLGEYPLLVRGGGTGAATGVVVEEERERANTRVRSSELADRLERVLQAGLVLRAAVLESQAQRFELILREKRVGGGRGPVALELLDLVGLGVGGRSADGVGGGRGGRVGEDGGDGRTGGRHLRCFPFWRTAR